MIEVEANYKIYIQNRFKLEWTGCSQLVQKISYYYTVKDTMQMTGVTLVKTEHPVLQRWKKFNFFEIMDIVSLQATHFLFLLRFEVILWLLWCLSQFVKLRLSINVNLKQNTSHFYQLWTSAFSHFPVFVQVNSVSLCHFTNLG